MSRFKEITQIDRTGSSEIPVGSYPSPETAAGKTIRPPFLKDDILDRFIRLREEIVNTHGDTPLETLAVTSAKAKEGKTTVAICLAFVFSMILPSGEYAGTPIELLSDDRFGKRIAALKNSFDIIIVDTPCVSQYQDFEFMGKRLDGTVLAVESDSTQLPLLLDVKHRIETSGSQILGVTLTRAMRTILPFMNRLMGLV